MLRDSLSPFDDDVHDFDAICWLVAQRGLIPAELICRFISSSFCFLFISLHSTIYPPCHPCCGLLDLRS